MTKFCDLSDEEMIKIIRAEMRGEALRRNGSSWESVQADEPIYFDDECRVRPTKPSIDWSHVAPEYVAMATQSGGTTFLHKTIPTSEDYGWNVEPFRIPAFAAAFASFRPGTCDWRDSLVLRPTAPLPAWEKNRAWRE